MEIPHIVIEKANELGWHDVIYIGHISDKLCFTKPAVLDEFGQPLPSGLPQILLFDGSNVIFCHGVPALTLLRNID